MGERHSSTSKIAAVYHKRWHSEIKGLLERATRAEFGIAISPPRLDESRDSEFFILDTPYAAYNPTEATPEWDRPLVVASVLAGDCMVGKWDIPILGNLPSIPDGRIILDPLRPSGRGVPALSPQLHPKEPSVVSVNQRGGLSGDRFPLVVMASAFSWRIAPPRSSHCDLCEILRGRCQLGAEVRLRAFPQVDLYDGRVADMCEP